MREPKIVFEAKEFIAVDKPTGLIVHRARIRGEKGAAEPALTDWLLSRYPEVARVGDDPEERPGIVHRLDKETSGLILVARTQEYFEYLKSQFQNHRIRKIYLALVRGEIKEAAGTIDKPIGIKDGSVKRSVHSKKMAKEAVTDFKKLRTLRLGEEDFTLLEVSPRTGRTHQIRVHLASIGHPIAGDALYGGKEGRPFGRMMLHACGLEFDKAEGERLHLETELPAEFKGLSNS